MGHYGHRFSIPLVLTLALFLSIGLTSNGAFWGLNHLAYLPSSFFYVALFLVAAAGLVLFAPASRAANSHLTEHIADFLFASGPLPRLLITLVFLVVFWLLRADVHFLGDGYGMIALYGQGETVVYKWTSLGPIWILRQLQSILGGYTETTSRQGLQIMSVVSGALFSWLAIEIARFFTEERNRRLLILMSLWCSGILLMWLGYTELYGPFWVASAAFLCWPRSISAPDAVWHGRA